MRLLERQSHGCFRLTDDISDQDIPRYPYAILSHRWGDAKEEVTFEDIVGDSGRNKAGYEKIIFCGEQAAKDNLRYFWIDSCCIRKSSDSELSEAIRCMFRWYSRAARCYVYLSDVSAPDEHASTSQTSWDRSFRTSSWFLRGWTLQELLAPRSVEFFSRESTRLGDKTSLSQRIHEITRIAVPALQGAPLSQFGVEERFEWARHRHTTREEDWAYCLLGIFEIDMSVRYGERRQNAVARLRKKIDQASKWHVHDTESMHSFEPMTKRRRIETEDSWGPTESPTLSKSDLIEALRFDRIEDRFLNIRKRHARTCKWFLTSREYLSWVDPEEIVNHHGFFWIHGKPGSGKSTLMKYSLEEIRRSSKDGVVLSFFFNARGEELEKNTTGLYRSALVQLLENCADDVQVAAVVEICRLRPDTKLNERHILKEVFAQLLQAIQPRDVTFVIDALDECDEDDVRDMVAFLESLGSEAVCEGWSFRVLFASRHYPHISIERSTELTLEDQSDHSQDIEKYLASELKGVKGKQAEQIREEIRKRAKGIFMWVVLVVRILNKVADRGQTRHLQKKLKEIPDDLHELFRTILTRDSENMAEMKLCLQWLMYATRPMRREELYFAIWAGLEPEDAHPFNPYEDSTNAMERFILSSSKGLAEVTKSKDHTVQFIHESVRDFLLKGDGLKELWPDLQGNVPGASHTHLRNCCWNQIRSCTSGYIEVDDGLPHAKSPEAVELRQNTSTKFPFLQYAVSNIYTHSDIASSEGMSQEDFLAGPTFSTWVYLNNLFEKHEIRRFPPSIGTSCAFVAKKCYHLLRLVKHHGAVVNNAAGRYSNPIFTAIFNDDLKAFEALVRMDNGQMPSGLPFPYHCDNIPDFLVTHGTAAMIERFLATYAIDLDVVCRSGKAILSWALEHDHEQLARQCITQGADGKVYRDLFLKAIRLGNLLNEALQLAIQDGSTAIVRLLIESGADPNTTLRSGAHPLYMASLRSDTFMVDLLLEKGADIDAPGTQELGNALYSASTFANIDIVRLLLERGANVNAQGGSYDNALQAASVHGAADVVKLLLDAGANVNAQGGLYRYTL